MSKQLFTLVLLFFLFCCLSAQGENKTAFLVGIDKYEDSQIPLLRFAAADAQKISRLLGENGVKCVTLLDGDATKERITEEFINLEQQTTQTGELELFIFYFSGRGTRIRDDIQADETQDGFDECFLPSDAVAGNPRSLIRDDAIARWMSAVNAKQVILILDCAFWGDDADANVKGLGKPPEAVELDGIEIADGLPSNAVILTATLPADSAKDGVFTTKLLEACVTEDADRNSNRIISFAESYQYAQRQLHGQQTPNLVGSADIPFAPLPPLSRLQIESTPKGAEILLYAGSEPATPGSESQDITLQLDEKYTPASVSLKQGAYHIRVQKPGFLIPEAKEVAIVDYDTLYPVEPFQLQPITVLGETTIINTSGETVSVEDAVLTLHVKEADKEIYQEALPADGLFRFEPVMHQWLKVGSEYALHITGQPVLAVEPALFTYDGYADIHTTVKVTLDDIPPGLSPDGITFQATRLIVGEELHGSVKAQDDGLGLADSIEIQLQPPNNGETISIPVSDIQVSEGTSKVANLNELIKQVLPPPAWEQLEAKMNDVPAEIANLEKLIEEVIPPLALEQMGSGELEMTMDNLKSKIAELGDFQISGVYQFRYKLPDTPDAAGEWSIAALTLSDKAGNTTHFSDDGLNAKFFVFATRLALGKDYFDGGNYPEALVQLKQVLTSPNLSGLMQDDALYLTALAHYQQGELSQALEMYQTIETKANYLGHARRQEMPKMPRQMVNKLWGQLLDNLDEHRDDAEYVSLLAATAEELGRSYEAKVYREYVKRLRKM